MLRGLLGLTWLEIKIFVREPMGVIGTVGIPVLVFVSLSRMMGPRVAENSPGVPRYVSVDLPIFASLMIAASAVLSLVAIIAIYREGGILKRLRATPLRPHTILTAHVLVKLLFTAVTLAVMVLAGRRYYPIGAHVPLVSFTLALLISTVSIALARLPHRQHRPDRALRAADRDADRVSDARPLGAVRADRALPAQLQVVARVLPSTYAVSLLRGIWRGDGLARAHRGRRDARGAVPGLHRDLGEGVPLGVNSSVPDRRAVHWDRCSSPPVSRYSASHSRS